MMDVCEREKSHEAPRRDGPELREGEKKEEDHPRSTSDIVHSC